MSTQAQVTNRYEAARFYVTVGERICATREASGLRQCDLAEKTGLAKSTIYHAENGESCSLLVLAKIAEALDVMLDELVPLEATR